MTAAHRFRAATGAATFALLAYAVFGPGCRKQPAAAPSSCRLVPSGFGPVGKVGVEVKTVVRDLEVPWALAQLPSGELLVTERPGRIRLVRQGRLLPKPVAKVSPFSRSDGGLLGLALHPDFAENRLFYIYLAGGNRARSWPGNRVERWLLSADATRARPDKVILEGIPAAPFHDGGRLRIGPDGLLYIGTGDATQPSGAQDRSSLAGKLLRLTLDGEVPPDNPWPRLPAFVSGIRNTQGFDWTANGTLVITDHGPSGEFGLIGQDEVSIARPGDNLGWPVIHGCAGRAGMVAPLISWARATPPGGAAIYRGSRIPEWRDSLLIATLGSQHLQRVQIDYQGQPRVTAHEVHLTGISNPGRLREVYMAPDGELYLTTSNCDGRGRCPPHKDQILRLQRR
jgi:glucose/arabinose dehydrogenase